MEKRIGVIAIVVQDRKYIPKLNSILSEYAHIILGRMGLPLREKSIQVISLIVDGTNDDIGALAGKIGRLPGISVKSMLTRMEK